jgi:hypothetical protein
MKYQHLIQGEHSLNIISLHDARAICSCGGWEFGHTGKLTRHEIERRHKMHLSFMAGKGGKLK